LAALVAAYAVIDTKMAIMLIMRVAILNMMFMRVALFLSFGKYFLLAGIRKVHYEDEGFGILSIRDRFHAGFHE